MNLGEIVVKFAADVQNFTRGAQQVTESVNQVHQQAEVHMRGFSSAVKGGLSSLLEFGAHAYQSFLLVQNAIQSALGFVGNWVQSAIDATRGQNQLNAVLKSTHDAVGMTASQINALTQQLKNFNGVDDDVILGGENMLLTFTSIGKNVFPLAAQAMTDLAVKMNGGVLAGANFQQAAIELGKALQDPLHAAGALARQGIQLNDVEKQQIAAFMAVGDTADAQKIILKEVENQIAGTAKAAANADPFNKFKLAMGDIGKAIGGILLPPLTTVANFITPLANQFLQWLTPAMQHAGDVLGQLGQGVGEVLAPLGQLWQSVQGLAKQAFQPLADFIQQHVAPAFAGLKAPIDSVSSPFLALNGAVSNFATTIQLLIAGIQTGNGPFGQWHGVLQQVGQDLAPLGNLVGALWGDAQQLVGILMQGGWKSFQQTLSDWGPVITQLGGWFQNQMLPALMQLVPPIENLVNIIVTRGVPAFLTIRNEASHLVSVLATTFLPIFERVEPIVVKLAGYLLDLSNKALAFLIPKIQQAAQTVGDFASGIATRLQPFIDKLSTGIQVAADIIQKVWGFLWPWVSGILKFAWDNVTGILNIGWQFISGLFNIFADILSGNWGQLWKDIQSTVGNIWGAVKSFVGNIWGDLKHLWDVGTGYISDAWNTLWGGLSSVASSAWDGVKGVIKDGINGAIDLLNKLIDAADHVPGVNIGHIPYVSFAAGGIMGQTGLAMVGERGPEMMLLPGGARIFNNDFVQQLMTLVGGISSGGGGSALQVAGIPLSAASAGGGSARSDLHIHVELGGREIKHIVQAIGPEMIAQLRNAGIHI